MGQKLLLIDTETGGLDPRIHSILSFAAVVIHDGAIEAFMYTLVNEGPSIISEDAALKVNGLTLEKIRAEGAGPLEAVNTLEHMLSQNDMRRGIIFAGHNVAFDIGFMKRLYGLAGKQDVFEKRFSHRSLCTQSAALLLMHAGRINPAGNSVSLQSLVDMWAIPLDREAGHDALNDARATAAVLKKELQMVGWTG